MRIYLASRFGRQHELRGYRDELVAMGHTVTSRWLDEETQAGDTGAEGSVETRRGFAEVDLHDLIAADAVVSFTEAPSAAPARGGRHVEFGVGWALGKVLIVVGHRENVFHCLREVEFAETWDDAKGIIALASAVVVTGAAVGLPADAVIGKVIAPTDQTFRDAERWRQGPVACAICCHEWTAVRPDGTNTGMECPKCHAMAGFEVEP